MKSELQGFRDLSAFRHFEIGVFNFILLLLFGDISIVGGRCIVLSSRRDENGCVPVMMKF